MPLKWGGYLVDLMQRRLEMGLLVKFALSVNCKLVCEATNIYARADTKGWIMTWQDTSEPSVETTRKSKGWQGAWSISQLAPHLFFMSIQ